MNVTPVAFESMGVRSMATLVESGVKVFIDPSAALCPRRFGLPPHKKEHDALTQSKKRIRRLAKKSDVFIVSHYHYDHHDPGEVFYGGKTVLAKNPEKKINKSQSKRGEYFINQLPHDCDLRFADGKSYRFDDLTIDFSPAYPHGPLGIRLGYVLMCKVTDGSYNLVYGSDVQGPVYRRAANWIIEAKPDLLIMDGPPTYFMGYRFSKRNLEKSKKNLLRIINETGCEVILDHHILRDPKYLERFREVYDTGKVKSAAEYLGRRNRFYEMRRKELWEK